MTLYKRFWFLSFFLIATLFSCEKVKELLTFEVHDSAVFTIPSLTGINSPLSIPVPPIKSSSSQAFENNNTKASLVKDVVLKELTLHITDPEDKTFKFLKSLEIYITADGEKEILLASKYNIQESSGQTLSLDPTGSKLDPYLKKDSYSIRTVVEVREIPGEDVTVQADLVFRVTADPI